MLSCAAAVALFITACGGSGGPDDPGGPGGPGPGGCREVLSGTIGTNRHLANGSDDCDYLIEGSNLIVEATLTADPGVVVAVAPGVRIMVGSGGSIDLHGTTDNPITFIGTTQEQGSWDGFCFGTNYHESTFDHVHVVWAGANAASTSSTQCRGAIGSIADHAPINITNSIIFGSRTTGIEATSMILGEFRDNRLAHHAEYGIRVSGENVGALDTGTDYAGAQSILPGTPTPNGRPYVYIRPAADGVETPNVLHTWSNLGVPYHVAREVSGYTGGSLHFKPDTRVAIEPGVVILVGPDIQFRLHLDALVGLFGTADNPVVITADSEDASPGHWTGIYVNGGGLLASHARISYGGQDSGVGLVRGNITFSLVSGPDTFACSYLANTRITDSESNGILIHDSYTDYVNLAASVVFENYSWQDVDGTAAGPVVTTFEEALACIDL